MENQFNFYVGTKSVKAAATTLGEYNTRRGWTIPEDEDPTTEGYLVEYENGHLSWSPKVVFDKNYRSSGKLTFSDALVAIKEGRNVKRSGWNGDNQFVYKLPGSQIQKAAGYGFGEYINEPTFRDMLIIHTTQGNLNSWVPSVGDLFAEDWVIVDAPVSLVKF